MKFYKQKKQTVIRIISFSILLFFLLGSIINAQIINEFEPNPIGSDPATQQIELKGTPGTMFTGFVISLECDASSIGTIDSRAAVSGTFDANGLLVLTINDVENPSFTLILCSASPVSGTDLDTDNDGSIDNPALLGTVYDAIGVADHSSEESNLYGVDLGGADFNSIGTTDPFRIFRDGSTEDWYAVITPSSTMVKDINGNNIPKANFAPDPTVLNYGVENSILPVELVSFKYQLLDQTTILSWITASEINNSHFNIQHSTSSHNFKVIGEVIGAGNSNSIVEYEYTHNSPVEGNNYYRLQQIDLDGTFAYSDIVMTTIKQEGARNNYIRSTMASDYIFIHTDGENAQMNIRAMNGQLIMSQSLVGDNNIDISSIVPGIYIVQLAVDGDITTEKIVKQ